MKPTLLSMSARRKPPHRFHYLEALELRTLLSAYLIPVTNHTDLIYDPIRNQLDIPSSTGILNRFDVSTKALLSPLTVGGTLGAGDITPDGGALYFTDTAKLTLHKIDLNSGATSSFTYTGASLESAGYDLAVTSNGLAIFDGQFAGSGWVPLRTVDLATDALAVYVPAPYPNDQVRQNTHIYDSADGSTLYFAESNSSAGPLSVYDAATRTVIARKGIGVSLSSALGAASRDGSQFALNINGVTTIRDRSLNTIKTNLPAGILAYNPVRNTLYILPSGSTTIQAYDTTTFALKGTFDASEAYSFSGPGNPMILSPDGSTLFVTTATGVRMVNVDESHLLPVTLATSAPAVTAGAPVTITASISYPSALPGTVKLMDGTVTLSTVPLINNVANFTTSTLSAGVHNLTATFIDGVIGSGSPPATAPLIVIPAGTPASLIAVTDHTDIIYDASRNQLDIVGTNGNLYRYSLASNQFVAALHMNGNPGYGDITPDGNFLYLTDLSNTIIHKVNLNTNAVTDLAYTGVSPENASYDLTIVSSTTAVFDSRFNNGSGAAAARTIDLTTDLISQGTTPLSSIQQDSSILRSADRNTVLFNQTGITSGTIYDAPGNTIVGNFGIGTVGGPVGAVSRDGTLFAYSDFSTVVHDRTLNVRATLPAGAISFNPTRNVLYILPIGATVVSAYDTSTFTLQGSYDLGQTFTFGTNTGIMTLSDDGNKLFVTTTTGIRAINVAALTANPPASLTVSAYGITAGQTLTLSASLANPTPLGGFIRFFDGSTLLATVTNSSANTAKFSTSTLATGSHNLSASYFDGGNSNAIPSAISTVLVLSAATPANLLPISDHTDLFFDSARHQLLIPSSTGVIYRYDVVAKQYLQPWHITGKPGYGDITADGNFLYLTDQAASIIHKVDLDTGAITDLIVPSTAADYTTWDLALTSATALFDGNYQFNSSSFDSVSTLDLASGNLGTAAMTQIHRNTGIFRSADRSTLLFTEGDDSGGPITVFNTATNTIVSTLYTNTFLNGPQFAVNADGSLIAMSVSGATTVRDRQLNVKINTLPAGPVGFNPVTGTLYVIPTGTANLRAYDPITFALKSTYAIGQGVAIDSVSRTGIITVSPDGGTLFVTTTTGIRTVTLNEALRPVATLTASAPTVNSGTNLTLTATLGVSAAGVVRFQEGANILATVTLAAGKAAYSTSTLSQGSHTFTAVFVDTAGRVSDASTPVSVSVVPVVTTLALSTKFAGSPTTPPTFHVIASGNPAGIVDLLEGNTVLATATLAAGAADLTPAAPLSLGGHILTAYFRGNANVSPATSAPLNLGISQQPSATSLVSSTPTILEDKTFTLTAAVTGATALTGTVTFFDGDIPLSTKTLNASGHAALNLSLPSGGTHHLTAQYNGSADYLPSTSAIVDEQVDLVARKLLYVNPLTTTAAGGTFQLQLQITDNQNVIVDSFSGNISIALLAFTGSGTLGGTTTVQAINGIATFPNLSLSAPGTYALRATDGTVLFGDLPGLVITQPATHLAFVTLPPSAVAGQGIPSIVVQFLDSANHLVPINGPATISLSKSAGVTLGGPLTVNAHDGTAIFDNLSLTKTGSYAFSVSSGILKPVTSKALAITPDVASARMVIATQPADEPLDKALPAITVNIVDQYNNLITSDASTVTLSAIGAGGTPPLNGKLVVKAVKGVAKFTGITPTQVGDYTLTILDSALTPVTTHPFNIFFVPKKLTVTIPVGGGAAGLTLPPLVVRILDAKARLVTTSAAPVAAAISASTIKAALLHGTLTVSAAAGIATFSDLSVDAPGTYTLKFTSGNLTLATIKLTVKNALPN